VNMMTQDTSALKELDDHFAEKRRVALELEAEAERARQAASLAAHTERMAGLRNERIRRSGVAALLGGAGLGLALFGASFLIVPIQERIVYTPGPERVVTRDAVPPVAKVLPPKTVMTPKEHDNRDMYDTAPYIGDIGYCNAIPGSEARTASHQPLFNCRAIHNDHEVDLDATRKQKPLAEHAANDRPTRPAENMVNVDVDAAGYQIKAMVDTGCSYPMAIPSALAAALLHDGRATFAGVTKSILADGKSVDDEVVMINQITVDGRTLHGVEAIVSMSNGAPILLGLGALNRLGPYSIKDGQLVFTGEQPA
jgi:gag-polyprotein putative aspartyl protease